MMTGAIRRKYMGTLMEILFCELGTKGDPSAQSLVSKSLRIRLMTVGSPDENLFEDEVCTPPHGENGGGRCPGPLFLNYLQRYFVKLPMTPKTLQLNTKVDR